LIFLMIWFYDRSFQAKNNKGTKTLRTKGWRLKLKILKA
jgi:hypothetical protein